MRRGRPPYPDLLTPREQEVLALIREGLTNEQIGVRLGISEHGAKYHVAEILSKLGVSSRQEAARWAQPQRAAPGLWGLVARHTAFATLAIAALGLLTLAVGVLLMNERNGGATTGGSQPQPQQEESLPPPPGVDDGPIRRIAYVERQGDEADIWTMNPDGSDKVQLTTSLEVEIWPFWSPDGRQIAYLSYTRDEARTSLMVMNADGSDPRQLHPDVGAIGELAWSPDGKHIAFSATFRGIAMNIFTINADGSALTALTNENSSNTSPKWTADGKRVLFSGGLGITVVDADGSNHRLLVPRGGGAIISVSPDARLAAVLRPLDADSVYRLEIVNLVDGRSIPLIDRIRRPESPVAWSSDSKWLAYAENIDADTWAVNISRPDGSDRATLVSETAPGRTILRIVGWTSDAGGLAYKLSDETNQSRTRERYCSVTVANASRVCFDTVFGMNEDGPTSPSLLLN